MLVPVATDTPGGPGAGTPSNAGAGAESARGLLGGENSPSSPGVGSVILIFCVMGLGGSLALELFARV